MLLPGADRCPSCGAGFQGTYCHDCGEKRLADEDRTVRHFLGEALGTLTNLDGTFWRSLRALVVRYRLLLFWITFWAT